MTAAENKKPAENTMSPSEVKYLETLLASKKYPELEQHCRAMLLKYPSINSLNYMLGLSLSGQKKFEPAIDSFHAFLREKDDYADAYINLGIACERLGRFADALNSYRNAIRLVPLNAVIHNKAGIVLQKTGAFKEAADSFQKAISLSPNCAEYHLHLAMMRNNLGEGDKAIGLYTKAIELAPDYVEAYQAMGRFLEQHQNMEEAINCYRKIAELEPDDFNNNKYLAMLYFQNRQFSEAAVYYLNADRCRPNDAEIYGCLSAVYNRLGQYAEALDYTQKALQINPELQWVLNNFAKSIAVSSGNITITPELVCNLTRCHETPRIDSTIIAVFSSTVILSGFSDCAHKPTLTDLGNIDSSTFRLLVAHLRNALISSPVLENILCGLREELLNYCIEHKALCPLSKELLEALSCQSSLNEYIWPQTESQIEKLSKYQSVITGQIAAGKSPDKYALFLLAAYIPVHKDETLRQWSVENASTDDELLHEFIETRMMQPVRLKELAKQIKPATTIDNAISQSVRSQYEENPYPQWWSISREPSANYIEKLKAEIFPNVPSDLVEHKTPKVLIAGCGTGRHALNAARTYKNSSVLAVDLSLSSLAYAQSKAEDFNITNIEFRQADILKLGELNKKFDIIECSGVLHHMEDPEAGLKVLLKLLAEDGYLKLGLYSQQARQSVSELRSRLEEKQVQLENPDIREFRASLKVNHPDIYDKVSRSIDFYSASAFRDLLLHVQEHQYTIPELKQMLSDHNLEFLGFITNDSRLKLSMVKQYPEDQACINLDNWHREELSRPQIFSAMYQFWCRRKCD
ncbi:MAG: tetratricopeptide repeat protein [Methyloligellaceae bacterium]